MRLIRRLGLGIVALSFLGGTCSKPPPYHDVSGTWVADGWGPGSPLRARSAGGDHDFDVAMTVKAAVPVKRGPVPISGTVCVRDAKLGYDGTYAIDPAVSTYDGSDYGGARVDIVAKAQDGRTLEIDQAFMANASPNELKGSIVQASRDKNKVSFDAAFKRRSDVQCP